MWKRIAIQSIGDTCSGGKSKENRWINTWSIIQTLQSMSHRLSNAKQRLRGMHSNEILNIKARCETLYQVKLEDKVTSEEKVSALKELALTVKDQEDSLFLAAEKGAGKNDQDVNAVLNPMAKEKATK